MALSRFWTFILILSIGYALVMLATGHQHSLGTLVNGNQGDPLVVAEQDSAALQGTPLLAELRTAGEEGVMRGDTLITLGKGGLVLYSHGTQAADGLFETCKNTVMDLWLPLIGYLTFFCGLMNLLVDSRAMEKLARFLSPIFRRIFPDLPGDHPAYGYMTLNFAANFLGLDNAATPFGLKAMEPERITARQIEAARRAITRHIKRQGRLWIRVFPDVPVSKKPAEVRQGKGKGAIEYWAARVKPGRILFELDGVPGPLAAEAFSRAAMKLPIKTKVVARLGDSSHLGGE